MQPEWRNHAAWSAPEGRGYRTTRDMSFEAGGKGSGLVVTIPGGTFFDVSTPRLLRWAVRPDDPRYVIAACWHDYTLQSLGWDRWYAAAAWRDGLLKQDGVSNIRRRITTLAVAYGRPQDR